jgi:histidine ammonia-lyase
MTIDAFAGRSGAFAGSPRIASASGPGETADNSAAPARWLHAVRHSPITSCRASGLAADASWDTSRAGAAASTSAGTGCRSASAMAARSSITRFLPFRGGKKHQPQDSYSLRCIPQVHGAVRDALAQAKRVLDIELNARHRQSAGVPGQAGCAHVEEQVISAGHFHGMPLALAMSYLKAAIPVLASISERRLNKLVDPATNDGLPAFLIGNEDGTESGHMIVQYTAAAIVNDLASRASGLGVFDPDQRERRGPCLDGRQRGAPCAGDGGRPGQGARAGAAHRRAGARPAPRHDQRRPRPRGSRRCRRPSPRRCRAVRCRMPSTVARSLPKSMPCASNWRIPPNSGPVAPSPRRMPRSAHASRSWNATRAMDGDVASAVALVVEGSVLAAARNARA